MFTCLRHVHHVCFFFRKFMNFLFEMVHRNIENEISWCFRKLSGIFSLRDSSRIPRVWSGPGSTRHPKHKHYLFLIFIFILYFSLLIYNWKNKMEISEILAAAVQESSHYGNMIFITPYSEPYYDNKILFVAIRLSFFSENKLMNNFASIQSWSWDLKNHKNSINGK